ncbi:hypothetical protein ST47_g5933 [Ascochyta rabiei]|uniref:Uncharacterized protein n=1 Tax=Didymella rabiei TaxID=5454 RepID=A0A163D5W6_DIDRA|nr:hypothetical protein ST47_g5933 [Ascochyta rabiei]
MSSRRPLQPTPALSANVSSTRYARTTTTSSQGADGHVGMEDPAQDHVQDSGSVVSGLTSLEGDDDFERLMIQNARDERRLHEALHGRAQPFRKARTHARVGLTIDNLERNDAQNSSHDHINIDRNINNNNHNNNINDRNIINNNNHNNNNINDRNIINNNNINDRNIINNNNHNNNHNVSYANARAAIKSPPSSTGSTHSDPAIHAPASWGRKGRSSGKWMRSITRDEQPQQTPAPPDETMIEQHDRSGANAPRRSVEDSPLSHKSFHQSTPPNDHSGQLDLTFDMDECSIIASTPYIPRNTKLDDILEREHMARLDGVQETSPEEKHRLPTHTHGTGDTDAQSQQQRSPVRRLHNRTSSWQPLSRPQPELGEENSPIAVYRKSVETVGAVERHVVAKAQRQSARPVSSRRTDSQHLLRRLARASNTPSPKAPTPAAPAPPAPPTQPQTSQTAVTDASHTALEQKEEAANETPAQETAAASTLASQEQPRREHRQDTPHDGTTPDVPSSAPTREQVDETPMPTEHTILNPKTPVVMGGWIDTPGPRTAHKPLELPHPRSQSPERGSPRKSRSPTRPTAPTREQQPAAEAHEAVQPSLPRPQLPSSALHALVQEARASHDYGDDTIHSLEDLITPLSDNEVEEDTLQGLVLPTTAPRNEAERERQAEVVHLHRLNKHLRATSTNIRDVSRGMRRVETRMEHIEVEGTGEKIPVIVRDHSHEFSLWTWFRSFFWDGRLKTQREARSAPLKMWGGITLLGVLLTVSLIWWASEAVACEIFCHPEYASYSPHPFAVDMDAPKRGVVIPTLVYRALFRSWSTPVVSPISSLLSWAWASLWSFVSGASVAGLSRASHTMATNSAPGMAAHTQASWKIQEEAHEEDHWDWSMAEDEILR